MEAKVYNISKKLINGQQILMTDTHSEILEISQKSVAQNLVDVMNVNTDNGCIYTLVETNSTSVGDLFEPQYPLNHD
jgi:hypothetical protein